MTLDSFKGPRAEYTIVAENLTTGEVYDCVPEKAIADIASDRRISNEQVLAILKDQFDHSNPEIMCESKDVRFWIEEVEK